jgi:hypothetical protein
MLACFPLLVLAALSLCTSALAQDAALRPKHMQMPAESRQFDFWVGTWDVNLRVQQEDLSWKDSIQAEARIYPICFGKAVLELWDSPNIKGYSLRYFDVKQGKWVLWLNWPGQNSSGSSSLSGSFRHGRGDFTSTNQRPDGSASISRYSFNDIGPNSLRWDDSYSDDGGKTWRNQWIMEFTRKAKQPTLKPEGGTAHTFVDGGRGTLPQYRKYEFLSGAYEGELDLPGVETPVPASWRGYRVLDGTAVIAFLRFEIEGVPREVFYHMTWNTYAKRYELTILDDSPNTSAYLAYSELDADSLIVTTRADAEGRQFRFQVAQGEGGIMEWTTQINSPNGDAWTTHATARLLPGTP